MGFTYTIVVPTFNEAENVEALIKGLREAMRGLMGRSRVLFIDDSLNFDTIAAVQNAATQYGTSHFKVDWYRRTGSERTGGLSGAVLYGMRACTTEEFIGVIDGDNQHPTELVPYMFRMAELVDVVATSRYRSGGSADGLDGFVRHAVSRGSNLLAKLLFPRMLGEVSDSMTGFFVIRRSAFNLDVLKPDGFKILLEFLCTHKGLRVMELPMHFGEREAGDSKGDLKNGMKFLRQLLRLRFTRPYRLT